MKSFFCLACDKVHETRSEKDDVFRTAFRAISKEKTHVPLGICNESQEKIIAEITLTQG